MPDAATVFPWLDSWQPEINLDTPAGRLVRELIQLPPDSPVTDFKAALESPENTFG